MPRPCLWKAGEGSSNARSTPHSWAERGAILPRSSEGQEKETGPEDGDGIVPDLYNTEQAQSHPLHTVLGPQEDFTDGGTDSLSRCLGSRDSTRRGIRIKV